MLQTPAAPGVLSSPTTHQHRARRRQVTYSSDDWSVPVPSNFNLIISTRWLVIGLVTRPHTHFCCRGKSGVPRTVMYGIDAKNRTVFCTRLSKSLDTRRFIEVTDRAGRGSVWNRYQDADSRLYSPWKRFSRFTHCH